MTEQNHQALLSHIQWASRQLASKVSDKKFQKELTRCRSKNVAKVRNRKKSAGYTQTFAKLSRHGIKSFLAIRSIAYGPSNDTEQYMDLTMLFGPKYEPNELVAKKQNNGDGEKIWKKFVLSVQGVRVMNVKVPVPMRESSKS